MTNRPDAKYGKAHRREAADWFVAINAEDVPSTEMLQAWLQWMDARAENHMAFEAVAQAWHSTPEIATSAMPSGTELQIDDYDPNQSVSEWQVGRHPAGLYPAVTLPPNTKFRRWNWAIAASLVAFIFGVSEHMWHLSCNNSQDDAFTTRTGEQIQLTLADGSQVWLGPRSTLLVGFTPAKRNLQLLAGEAFFSVKKDKTRPFVVHSAGGNITAIGTAFNVRSVDRIVLLTVSEGTVTLSPSQPSESAIAPSVRVTSGQQVAFTAHTAVAALKIKPSAAPGERSRWRDGILVYRDEPLSSVIKDISRYRSRPLDLPDLTVGELRFSGVIYVNALDEWLAALPESFPVRIVTLGEKEEVLSR